MVDNKDLVKLSNQLNKEFHSVFGGNEEYRVLLKRISNLDISFEEEQRQPNWCGCTWYNPYTNECWIRINRCYKYSDFDKDCFNSLVNTVAHEMLHVLDHNENGHAKRWRKLANLWNKSHTKVLHISKSNMTMTEMKAYDFMLSLCWGE